MRDEPPSSTERDRLRQVERRLDGRGVELLGVRRARASRRAARRRRRRRAPRRAPPRPPSTPRPRRSWRRRARPCRRRSRRASGESRGRSFRSARCRPRDLVARAPGGMRHHPRPGGPRAPDRGILAGMHPGLHAQTQPDQAAIVMPSRDVTITYRAARRGLEPRRAALPLARASDRATASRCCSRTTRASTRSPGARSVPASTTRR